ncbi:Transaldolase [Escovopsis weberi]|uniref:Transaldolase n=1 Tax=Escovopsis weberi TaxID=150374 RepID=A0A0M9VUN3_ESCWE|nr:Transaldolase [Escovopsis weberi]
MAASLLHRIEAIANVDVDDARTDLIKGVPFTTHNQTSNQGIITTSLLDDPALLKDLVLKHGSLGWENVYNHAAVLLCARNVRLLSGRVLVQTSLRHVHSRPAILAQCREYARLFAAAGIPADRFAIKLPMSGAAAAAARELNAEGIRTLATAVFSFEQAVAASQSDCLFISPYYNEIMAHLDRSRHVSYQDTALENPMSCRVVQMLDFFAREHARTGKPQPIMVIASFLTSAEVLAMVELGCPHITIPANLIQELLSTPDTLPPLSSPKPPAAALHTGCPPAPRLAGLLAKDPLAGPGWSTSALVSAEQTDFVADGGAALDTFLARDPVAKERFAQAERFFLEQEECARVAIEEEMAASGVQVLK